MLNDTNEEYIKRISEGHKEVIPLLYENIRKLTYRSANRYYKQHESQCQAKGITADDLIQEGYFAFLEAIEYYINSGIDKGYKFTTYLRYPLKNRFNQALGTRTLKSRHEPLNNYISYDEPLNSEEDGITLIDILEDKAAQEPFDEIIQNEFIQSLHENLDAAMDHLPDIQRDVITEKYYNNKTFTQIAADKKMSIEWVRNQQYHAFRRLNHIKELKPYREEILQAHAYRHIGVDSFIRNMTSSTEYAAIKDLEKYDCIPKK